MPTYEYQCERCSQRSEVVLPIRRFPALGSRGKRCSCGGSTVRVMSVPTVNFEAAAHQAHGYPHESITCTGLEGCEKGPRGGSMIVSATHEREVARRNGLQVI